MRRFLACILLVAPILALFAGTAFAVTNKQLVIILCKFTDQTNEPHPVSYYQDMFSETGTGKLGVFDYWRDVSYGNLVLTGSVVKGWYTSPMTAAQFNVANRADQIDTCASQAVNDVNFNNFAGVVVLTNHTNLNGPLFGSEPPTTIKGISYSALGRMAAEEDQQLSGILHESGHALGVKHSRKITNNPAQQIDYGDIFDIGSCLGCFGTTSYQGLEGPCLNVVQLQTSGWLPANRVLDFGSGGCAQQTIQLAAPNHPEATGYFAVRVPAAVSIFSGLPSATTGDLYTVEFRHKSGWDGGIQQSGVVIHAHGQDTFSYWIDGNGPWGAYVNGTSTCTPGNWCGTQMLVGSAYADASKQNFFVAVNSIDASAPTAVVTVGARGPNAQGDCKLQAALSYVGDTTGDFNDQVTLTADLFVTGTTTPVPRAAVSFKIGAQVCSAATNTSGRASCGFRLNQHPGAYNV